MQSHWKEVVNYRKDSLSRRKVSQGPHFCLLKGHLADHSRRGHGV